MLNAMFVMHMCAESCVVMHEYCLQKVIFATNAYYHAESNDCEASMLPCLKQCLCCTDTGLLKPVFLR
jgi:hypothetical protein